MRRDSAERNSLATERGRAALVTGDRLRDACRGCLLGTAVGDALGAPGEFLRHDAIVSRFGAAGISALHPWDSFPAGSFTDDTQLTLATAEGLRDAALAAAGGDASDPEPHVLARYLAWYETQADPRQRRHPGHTCLSALRAAKGGHRGPAANLSKGCGGVMRMAPAGLVPTPPGTFALGCRLAALTHGHPFGYLSAGFVADLCAGLRAGQSLLEAVRGSLAVLEGDADADVLAGLAAALGGEATGERGDREHAEAEARRELAALLRRAMETAAADLPDEVGVARFGEGWVGEEALAIALFCCLRHEHDWRVGVLAAIQHDGDTDSTGAISGAILGTSLGVGAMPAEWTSAVEHGAEIVALADDLWRLWDGAEEPTCG
jgi:ADP-ribosylglycohydrolase